MDQYQEYIAASRYARFVDDKQRRETWAETVDRYVDYIFSRTPAIQSKTELRNEIFDAIHGKEETPESKPVDTENSLPKV
jgi:ribonucleoside-diphosphate reductase alpha chain